MKKLRILHLLLSDPTQFGGVQTHIYYLTQALVRQGHDVTVFGAGENPVFPYPNYSSFGRVLPVPTPNGSWIDIGFGNSHTDQMLESVKRRYDICHIHQPYLPFLSWQMLLNFRHLPIVATFHSGWDPDSPGRVLLIKPILFMFRHNIATRLSAAIFVSQLSKNCWVSVLPKRVKTSVIPNAIDHSLYTPAPKKKSDRRVHLLFVGRLIPRKGALVLLRAFNHLRREGKQIELTIIGSGQQSWRIREYITNHHLAERVTLMGQISEAEKIAAFQRADIFCAPYRDEAFGITLIEAMACGVPIVGFSNGAFREILKQYPEPSLLVDPQDFKAFKAALAKLISQGPLRARLKRWCISESKKYSWTTVANKVSSIYQHLL